MVGLVVKKGVFDRGRRRGKMKRFLFGVKIFEVLGVLGRCCVGR